jgi:uncharacterized membrane protein
VVGAVGGAGAVVLLVRWSQWQNDQRDDLGMERIDGWTAIPVLLLALVLLAVLVAIGRGLANAARAIDRAAARSMPSGWSRAVAVVVIVLLVVVAGRFGGRTLTNWADRSFGLVNTGTADGVEQPTVSTVSGGPDALVEWDTLGFQGRSFVAGVTDVEELQSFAGAGAVVQEPVRVYVGIDSANSLSQRVTVAMRELERTGAFEREVLVVATSTGTGWINPIAARSLELMYGGDSAIVSMQYSFLPSWISFLVQPDGAPDAAEALYDAVRARWEQLEPRDRPRLLVFGESLGSFGGEQPFARRSADRSLTALAAGADGALFVGPTADNVVYGQMIDERDPGSPEWRPVLERVPTVRSAVNLEDIAGDDPTWTAPRTLYLHHPTDAVGTWAPSTIWRTPGWIRDTSGPGIPDVVRFFPVVTWVQETADLMAGFSAVPGFGHDYGTEFADAWAAVAAPDAWTPADTRRLADALATTDVIPGEGSSG